MGTIAFEKAITLVRLAINDNYHLLQRLLLLILQTIDYYSANDGPWHVPKPHGTDVWHMVNHWTLHKITTIITTTTTR